MLGHGTGPHDILVSKLSEHTEFKNLWISLVFFFISKSLNFGVNGVGLCIFLSKGVFHVIFNILELIWCKSHRFSFNLFCDVTSEIFSKAYFRIQIPCAKINVFVFFFQSPILVLNSHFISSTLGSKSYITSIVNTGRIKKCHFQS